MKRANLYALLIVTTLLFLFCLAAAAANAQEAGNDESIVTPLGEVIDELFAQDDVTLEGPNIRLQALSTDLVILAKELRSLNDRVTALEATNANAPPRSWRRAI